MPDSYLKNIGFKGKKIHKKRQSNVLQHKKKKKKLFIKLTLTYIYTYKLIT